jgi:hypothetical protein
MGFQLHGLRAWRKKMEGANLKKITERRASRKTAVRSSSSPPPVQRQAASPGGEQEDARTAAFLRGLTAPQCRRWKVQT